MNRWLAFADVSAGERVNVFCFSFAGGGASFFRGRVALAPRNITLCGVQYPGREERMAERPYTSLPELIAAAADALLPHLDTPFALFGHSMGALVAYELAQELRERRAPLPRHLFVSGTPAPHIGDDPPVYNLPEEEFITAVRRFGGLPPEVLQSPELLRLLLPRMRADLTVTGTYQGPKHPPLSCPITAFTGRDDAIVSVADVDAWRDYTTAAFRLEVFDGGHFFITEYAGTMFARIGQALA
jgi:medium-chain acyl-[acyl-carrier-protein] hydrolase